MRLSEEYIKKYLADFHYELTREQLEQDWVLDENAYYKEKNCWKFHAADGCWLEVADEDVDKAFVDSENLDIETMVKSINTKNSPSQYINDSFLSGIEYEKKKATEACKKVIDAFYMYSFNPTVDYMQIFKENL